MGVNVRSFVDPSDISGVIGDFSSCESGITASTTQSIAGAYQLTKAINRISTSATAGNAVKLPAAKAGTTVIVFNKAAANAVGVYPQSTADSINAITSNGPYSVAVTKGVVFVCSVDGQWDTILTA
jgi:hypothetical protein